jgi:uncharacterized protein YecE (DUF72 family)
MSASIRIGTCSWADESLTKYFYPPDVKGAEERLRYYTERFDTVEANSTYYHLPSREMVERWAERTPDGFVMHVKAFGVMTRHPVKLEQLPTDLRDDAPVDSRGGSTARRGSSGPRSSAASTRRSSRSARSASWAGS